MSDAAHIRKLWPFDFGAYRRHLKRLDAETHQARFGTPVSDAFLDSYADTSHRLGTVVLGAFRDGEIHASAELRPLGHAGPAMAEAAFTVEKEDQGIGLGTALMERIIATARNRGISRLHMICLRHNSRMRQLAGKFGAELLIDEGEVTGHIAPRSPTMFSVFEESIADTQSFMIAIFDWTNPAPGAAA